MHKPEDIQRIFDYYKKEYNLFNLIPQDIIPKCIVETKLYRYCNFKKSPEPDLVRVGKPSDNFIVVQNLRIETFLTSTHNLFHDYPEVLSNYMNRINNKTISHE